MLVSIHENEKLYYWLFPDEKPTDMKDETPNKDIK